MRRTWIVGLFVLSLMGCQEKNAFASQFLCGDTIVHFKVLNNSKADMKIANTTYALKQVISASGAKYAALDHADTIFWNKGNKAYITIEGKELPECIEKNSAQSEIFLDNKSDNIPTIKKVKNITWQLEDLNQSGIIDNSHITLLFEDENQINGSAGCNRYMGQYHLEEERLDINPHIASTMMACAADSLMQQEKLFLGILSKMKKISLDETGALILHSDDGKTLKFRQTTP